MNRKVEPHLPPGAVARWVKNKQGKRVVNVTGDGWQVAVKQGGNIDEAVITKAHQQQALHEHKQAILAARSALRGQFVTLETAHAANRDTKVSAAIVAYRAARVAEQAQEDE